jgi:hypothetical protein
MSRWILLFLCGFAHAGESCQSSQAEAIWQTLHSELQVLLAGPAVSQPHIILYNAASDLPNNSAESLLGYYQPTEQTIHVFCPAPDDEQALGMAVRHEGTHHYLWQVFGRLPAWLDEGLSTYMEISADPEGVRKNALRRAEFVDMLKWGRVPLLRRLLIRPAFSDRPSQNYAAHWALVFALLHHPDLVRQNSRRQLLLQLLARSAEGADVINDTFLRGLLEEEVDLSTWQLRWHRQIWDADFHQR